MVVGVEVKHGHVRIPSAECITATRQNYGGFFAQRAHSAGTAPIITLFIPGTPLKTTPLQKDA